MLGLVNRSALCHHRRSPRSRTIGELQHVDTTVTTRVLFTVHRHHLELDVKEFVVARDLAGGGRLGYLRISGFGGYLPRRDASYASQLAKLDRALNTGLTSKRVGWMHSLIIDA